MDALTNWDGIDQHKALRFNAVVDVAMTETGVEPVSVDEAKVHMNITFDDNDAKIEALISQCRAAMERHKAISLIGKEVTAVLHNGVGNIELPYGPVVDIIEVKRGDQVVTDYTITGVAFKQLQTVSHEDITIKYEAGYTTIPPELKLELLDMVAYVYDNPGKTDEALRLFSKSGSRKSWL